MGSSDLGGFKCERVVETGNVMEKTKNIRELGFQFTSMCVTYFGLNIEVLEVAWCDNLPDAELY